MNMNIIMFWNFIYKIEEFLFGEPVYKIREPVYEINNNFEPYFGWRFTKTNLVESDSTLHD